MKTGAYNRLCQGIIKVTEVIVCLILAFLVLDVLWGVFTRFVINEQSRWTEEVAIYLLIWVSLLGAAITYAENGHLGVDYLVHKWDAATQKIGAAVVHLVVLLFAAYGMLYGGYRLVSETMKAGQISPAIEIPMAVVYSAVPISGALFVMFAMNALVTPAQLDTDSHGAEAISDV